MKIFALSLFSLMLYATTALAYSPQLAVTATGPDQYQVYITAAQPNSSVDLFTRQPEDTKTWTVIRGFSVTDSTGSVSTALGIGTARPDLPREFYAAIASTITNTVKVLPYSAYISQLTFSDSTPDLNTGTNQTVYVYGANQRAIYVASNSNPYAVGVYISDSNTLVIQGLHAGSASVRISTADNVSSGVLNVNVADPAPIFVTTSLPNASVNTFYNQHILVSGGISPYKFSLSGGTLPAGLILTDDGWIYGTPRYAQAAYFEVRVADNLGAQATKSFQINVTVQSQQSYRNGQLVIENGTIYQLYKNQRTGFATMSAFRSLGYSLANVEAGFWSGLPATAYVVNTSNVAHPWGSWVKSGYTVYFVHESGLIPITTYDIFVSNGGLDKLLVPLNWYDAQLPVQSFMTYGDIRLGGQDAAQHTRWVQLGETFSIQLDSNPTTGYQWNLNFNSAYLRLVSRTYTPTSTGLVGSGGAERFEFQALSRGQTNIDFDYVRPWETGVSNNHQTYQINIQ